MLLCSILLKTNLSVNAFMKNSSQFYLSVRKTVRYAVSFNTCCHRYA